MTGQSEGNQVIHFLLTFSRITNMVFVSSKLEGSGKSGIWMKINLNLLPPQVTPSFTTDARCRKLFHYLAGRSRENTIFYFSLPL